MGADSSLHNIEQKWNEDTSVCTHLDRQKLCLVECCCGRLSGKKLSVCPWQCHKYLWRRTEVAGLLEDSEGLQQFQHNSQCSVNPKFHCSIKKLVHIKLHNSNWESNFLYLILIHWQMLGIFFFFSLSGNVHIQQLLVHLKCKNNTAFWNVGMGRQSFFIALCIRIS